LGGGEGRAVACDRTEEAATRPSPAAGSRVQVTEDGIVVEGAGEDVRGVSQLVTPERGDRGHGARCTRRGAATPDLRSGPAPGAAPVRAAAAGGRRDRGGARRRARRSSPRRGRRGRSRRRTPAPTRTC